MPSGTTSSTAAWVSFSLGPTGARAAGCARSCARWERRIGLHASCNRPKIVRGPQIGRSNSDASGGTAAAQRPRRAIARSAWERGGFSPQTAPRSGAGAARREEFRAQRARRTTAACRRPAIALDDALRSLPPRTTAKRHRQVRKAAMPRFVFRIDPRGNRRAFPFLPWLLRMDTACAVPIGGVQCAWGLQLAKLTNSQATKRCPTHPHRCGRPAALRCRAPSTRAKAFA
mgnify:CR=1 FL=1